MVGTNFMESDGNNSKNKIIEENEKNNEFNFLPDDPVTEDEFGSHISVADSIAHEVESDDRGITVGLEGTWGSGKSSVIKMIEERWKESEEICVFTFDAWAHQGDPLKRAFLEELITSLQIETDVKKAWLNKRPNDCDWEYEKCKKCGKRIECRPDEIREVIRLRREHNTITSEPTVTDWGKAFAIATLAMPIGVALLAAAPKLTGWYFWLGTILSSSPLIIIAACMIYRWFKKDHATHLLGEFVGKTKEVTKHTTQRSVDPTAIEFREYYLEILRLALETNNRKLVVVVDNLDRVESETALSMWGTIRTFLDTNNSQENKIVEHIWVIVPYDPDSITKLWDDKHKGMGRAFKEKTFQVRYRVAAPLASRWEVYFKKKLVEALPRQDAETQHSIYHIFRIQALKSYGYELPTPREMKLFINRMVALAKQHFPDISLEEIALYAATELSEPQKLENLVAFQPENEKFFVDLVGEDWKNGLAAIQFGVMRKEAEEVLYEPRIRDFLSKGDYQALESIMENTGAPQCCERYVRNFAPGMQTEEVLTASSAFTGYEPENANWHVKESIRCLAKRIATSESKDWKFGGVLNEERANHIIRMLKFDNSICEKVKNRLSIRVTGKETAAIGNIDEKIASWVKTTIKIVQYLSTISGFDPTLRLQMPDSQTYLKILDLVLDETEGKNVLQFFCPAKKVTKPYLNDYLAKIQQGEIRPKDIEIIQGLLIMTCWESEIEERVASSLESAMKPDLPHDKIEYVFRLLYTQINNTVFEQKLKNITESGRVFEFLDKYHGQPSCAAFCMGTIFMYHPEPKFEPGHAAYNGQQKYHELLENPDENIAKNIGKYCIEFDWLEDINKSVHGTDAAESNCMAVILRKLVNQDNNNDYLNTERFISCHSVIKSNLDNDKEEDEVDPYETLVGQLLKKTDGNLLSALQDRETDIEFGHAYYIVLNDEESDTSSLANKLCQELREKLGKNEWLKQLEDEDWMVDVVIKLVEKEYKPKLDNKFVDALIEHTNLLIDAKVSVKCLADSWPKLPSALSDEEREEFRRQLPDVMSNAGPSKSVLSVARLYEEEFNTAIAQADKQVKKRFVDQTCMNILKRDDEKEKRWMITLLANEKSLIKSAGQNSKVKLQNRLTDFLREEYAKVQSNNIENNNTDESENADSEWLSAIEKIAKQLGVKLKPEDEKKDANQKDSKLNQ